MAEDKVKQEKCELYAFLDSNGYLVIEVDSVSCQQIVMDAVEKTGIRVRYIKPEEEIPANEIG